MKTLLIFSFFSLLSIICFGQTSLDNKEISWSYTKDLKKPSQLEIINFKDTVKEGPGSDIMVRLINQSDSPITICERSADEIYIKIVPQHPYKTRGGKYLDTITGQCIFRLKYDGIPVVCNETILRPGDCKNFKFSLGLWGWYKRGLGKIKMKIFYDLKRLNEKEKDAESDWVYLYFP